MSDRLSFSMPDLGEGVHEAEILAIPVSVGQQLTEGETILEVETDKAAVEIPSPFTATVEEILVKVGDMVQVGQELIRFGTVDPAATALPAGERTTTGNGPGPTSPNPGPIPAAPSTRRLARELGVSLAEVSPTGKGGVVTREDVENFAASAGQNPKTPDSPPDSGGQVMVVPTPEVPPLPAVSLPDFSRWGEIETIPFRSVRRATGRQMSRSWREIPHVHCEDLADITLLDEFRKKHRAAIEKLGGRLTMTVFALKALATGLREFPLFNSSLDTENQQIVIKKYFHINIAVDSPGGLLVPVIRDVDRKSIRELAIEVQETVNRVRNGEHSPEEMQGGTFTITNAGALGGNRFSAIINHPQVAILGLGQGRWQPTVVTNDRGKMEIVPRLQMPIMLCFDHRVVDGADAIRFLRVIINGLEDPDELLISMI